MTRHPRLVETLRDAQRFGFFGPGSIEAAIVHADAFADAIEHPSPGSLVIDIGSGGGLPGLVLADRWEDAEVVLVDRRRKRTDFLERAVRRLGFDHVTVRPVDTAVLVAEMKSGVQRRADVVTARGFGPPEFTLMTAVSLKTPDGVVLISEPPEGDRWADAFLSGLGLRHRRVGPIGLFEPGTPDSRGG